MTESQKVVQAWDTPSHDEIPKLSKMHVGAMEQTDDDLVWVQAGMHHVLLRVLGRRTGSEQKVALPFWRDADGNRIVVASYAGAAQHPAWFLNLEDRAANPEVLCRVQGNRQFWSAAEILDGEDYTRTWQGLTADRAWYNDYQAKTARRIPLVRLPETRPA